MIHQSALPPKYQSILSTKPIKIQKLGRKTTSTTATLLKGTALPESNCNITIDSQLAYLFYETCQYDIIFCADFLAKFGLTMNYDKNPTIGGTQYLPERSKWDLWKKHANKSQQQPLSK